MPITVIPAPDNSGAMQGLQNLLAVLMQLRQEDIRKKERAEETGMEQAKNLVNVIGSVAGEDIGTREAKTSALNENPDLLRRALGISEIGSPVATGVEGFAGIGGAVPKVTTKRVIGGAGKTAGDVEREAKLAEQTRLNQASERAARAEVAASNKDAINFLSSFDVTMGGKPVKVENAQVTAMMRGEQGIPAAWTIKPKNQEAQRLSDFAEAHGLPVPVLSHMILNKEYIMPDAKDKQGLRIGESQLALMSVQKEILDEELANLRAGLTKEGKPTVRLTPEQEADHLKTLGKELGALGKTTAFSRFGASYVPLSPKYVAAVYDPISAGGQEALANLGLSISPQEAMSPAGRTKILDAAITKTYLDEGKSAPTPDDLRKVKIAMYDAEQQKFIDVKLGSGEEPRAFFENLINEGARQVGTLRGAHGEIPKAESIGAPPGTPAPGTSETPAFDEFFKNRTKESGRAK